VTLRIAKGLALPIDFATKTAAILAQRRKGKTYTASVIAEEMVAAKQPFVALDPTGAWYGLRSPADGHRDGLPVVILGGQHADLPLERTGGKLVADLVVEEPGYYVIDFSLFESGEAERQFAIDFAERLYRAKGQPGHDFPLHLFIDEADRFIPQQLRRGSNETSARLLGAFEAIVRRGGLRGLGTTLISQRAAVVNKNVLEMLDVLIVLRTVGPNDRDAIDSYIEAHGTDEERKTLLASLASLEIGEAWVWEPGAEPPLFQRVRIRERRTFNSSATPKPGERRVEPRRLAAVDLEKYRSRMAATIERAKAEDPKELRRQLADVQRELAAVKRTGSILRPDPEAVEAAKEAGRIEARRLHDQQLARAVASAEAGRGRAARAIDQAAFNLKATADSIERARAQLVDAADALREAIDVPEVSLPAAPRHPIAAPARVQRRETPARTTASAGDTTLGKGERATLIATAQQDDGAARNQLTVLTGYKRSTRDAYIARLKGWGLVREEAGLIFATDEGIAALGSDYEPLPTGAELREYWLARLPDGERKILAILIESYPKPVERAELDAATGYARSSRDAYLSRLAAKRLIETTRGQVTAAKLLF